MKILILHGIDSVEQSRRTSIHHAFFLPRHQPNHEYWLQAAHAPVTPSLLAQEFDVIVVDTTFLCWRWSGEYFRKFKTKFDFVKKSNAVKIAFPQDEYDHSAILEDWLLDWRVDVVYSVCFEDRDVFYPKLRQLAEVRLGYTGFYEAADIAIVSQFALPWRERTVDVGYRAKQLPAYFGSFGKLKSDIAAIFQDAAAPYNLHADISCRPEDAFMGDAWLRFLGRCRFILGCESGSSILDPQGEVRARCEAYIAARPDANFEMIAANCFAGEERGKPFKAMSPRLFEAAAASCGQILVIGDYGGVLKPWTHYLPLAPDASNIEEVVAAMADISRMEEMIRKSQDVLLKEPCFTYEAYAQDVISAVLARRPHLQQTYNEESEDGLLRLALTTAQRWGTDYTQAISVQNSSVLSRAKLRRNLMRKLLSSIWKPSS